MGDFLCLVPLQTVLAKVRATKDIFSSCGYFSVLTKKEKTIENDSTQFFPKEIIDRDRDIALR